MYFSSESKIYYSSICQRAVMYWSCVQGGSASHPKPAGIFSSPLDTEQNNAAAENRRLDEDKTFLL